MGDQRKLDKGKGGNPFDADGSAAPSANPFDSEEEATTSSSKNPFGNEGGNPFGSESSTNPFDDPVSKPPQRRDDGGTTAKNPFDSHPKASLPQSESKMKLSESKMKLSENNGAKSPSRPGNANPFEDSKPDLHMVPPREARSSIASLPPFVEGEVSCVILAECTGYQVMKNPKEHAVYTLTITATLSMKNAIPFSWSVKRRNKQFEALHASLSQHLDVSNLPPLPKKTWVRSLDPAYLESRRQAFDRYIQAVIQYYGEDSVVCTWLCDSFHKILLPFLHKQMEDRVTTEQLRHHLAGAVAREHSLEQEAARHAEKEKAQEKAVLQLQHAKLATEEKCRELEQAANEAKSACADAKVQMQAWKSEYEKRQQQILVLQDELEQTQKKLKEREKLPPPTNQPASPPPPQQPPEERKMSVTNSTHNPFDDPPGAPEDVSATGNHTANTANPANGAGLLDSASLIDSLSKPLFETPQPQWACATCHAENKLPVVQCVQCRAVKPLSLAVELTITNIHKVQRNPKEEPFAEYLLQVKLGTFSYQVRRRFSDFEKLHDGLVSFFGRMDTMPSLPKTPIFGGGNSFDPAFLQQRRTQLQAFLHGIAKHSLFFHCGPLCGWLVLDSVDGLFGPLIRAASTQHSTALQLAEHVKELESTVSAKTQLLVETLELRNRLEENLETEKATVAQLRVEGEKLLAQMQSQQSQDEAEISRLKESIEEQSKSAAKTRAHLELELGKAQKDIERLAQEAASLMLSLADADRGLKGEKAAKESLEQQLNSALSHGAQVARELEAAELRAKAAEERALAPPVSTPPEGAAGTPDGFCVVSPPLSPSQRGPDAIALPPAALLPSSAPPSADAPSPAPTTEPEGTGDSEQTEVFEGKQENPERHEAEESERRSDQERHEEGPTERLSTPSEGVLAQEPPNEIHAEETEEGQSQEERGHERLPADPPGPGNEQQGDLPQPEGQLEDDGNHKNNEHHETALHPPPESTNPFDDF